MPKLKTVRGAAKRFKTTASGRVKYSRGNRRHILTKKSRKRKRGLRGTTTVHEADAAKLARMLPYK